MKSSLFVVSFFLLLGSCAPSKGPTAPASNDPRQDLVSQIAASLPEESDQAAEELALPNPPSEVPAAESASAQQAPVVAPAKAKIPLDYNEAFELPAKFKLQDFITAHIKHPDFRSFSGESSQEEAALVFRMVDFPQHLFIGEEIPAAYNINFSSVVLYAYSGSYWFAILKDANNDYYAVMGGRGQHPKHFREMILGNHFVVRRYGHNGYELDFLIKIDGGDLADEHAKEYNHHHLYSTYLKVKELWPDKIDATDNYDISLLEQLRKQPTKLFTNDHLTLANFLIPLSLEEVADYKETLLRLNTPFPHIIKLNTDPVQFSATQPCFTLPPDFSDKGVPFDEQQQYQHLYHAAPSRTNEEHGRFIIGNHKDDPQAYDVYFITKDYFKDAKGYNAFVKSLAKVCLPLDKSGVVNALEYVTAKDEKYPMWHFYKAPQD